MREKRKITYENMYKNFMTNYSKTLKDMLEHSKNFYANKARGRKTLKEE